MANEQETMDNFGGFDNAADINFFGEDNTDATPPTAPQDTTGDTPQGDEGGDDTGTTPPAEPGESTAEETSEPDNPEGDINFFDEVETDDEGEPGETPSEPTEDDGDDTPEQPTGNNINLLNQLKEKGLLNYELPEGEELTEERAAELLEDSYEETLDSRLEEMISGLPPITKDLIRFYKNGGDETEFLSQLSKQPTLEINKDLNLDDEKNQEAVMRKHLQAEGHDDEYISSNIEFLKETGKIGNLSKKVFDKMIENDEKSRAEKVKQLENQRKQMKENQRKFKSDLSEFLKESKEVNGLKFTDQDKDLPSYISDSKIKTDNGEISEMQRDLYQALQDREKTMVLAKLLKSDFDFSDIANSAKTAQTRKVQEDVRRTNAGKSSGSSRSKKSAKNLWDLID